MTANFADKVALARRVLEWFRENAADLGKKGLNVEHWVRDIDGSLEAVVHADELQESLKAQLKAATRNVEELLDTMYRITSGAIDAAAGAYGKGSPQAVQLQRMRSKLHLQSKDEEGAPAS